MKLYGYGQCGTCRKALKWLAEQGLEVEMLPIRETPPSAIELRQVLKAMGGQRKRLLNTSSADYRSWPHKGRVEDMDEAAFIAALQAQGNLIKRPFLIVGNGGTTGFKEAEWEQLLP